MESTSIRFIFLTYSTFLALLSFLLTHSVRRRVLNEFFTGSIKTLPVQIFFTRNPASIFFLISKWMNLKLRQKYIEEVCVWHGNTIGKVQIQNSKLCLFHNIIITKFNQSKVHLWRTSFKPSRLKKLSCFGY